MNRKIIILLALLSCLNVSANEKLFKWAKQGKEAVIVFINGKEKKVVAKGYDPKFKSPGPFKNGFLWDDLYIQNYTWVKHADPSKKHPVDLLSVCYNGYDQYPKVETVLSGFDDVVYLFDDRAGHTVPEYAATFGIYFKVKKDGKYGVVGLIKGKPQIIIPIEYDYFIYQILFSPIHRTNQGDGVRLSRWGWGTQNVDTNGNITSTFYTHDGKLIISGQEDRFFYDALWYGEKGSIQKEINKRKPILGLWANKREKLPSCFTLLSYYGALAVVPKGEGAGGMFYSDYWNTGLPRQPIFFLKGKNFENSMAWAAGERNTYVTIPESFLEVYSASNGRGNFLIREDAIGSYMALSHPDYAKRNSYTGFVNFGSELVYLPPVFNVDFREPTARPERFLTLPSDSAHVFFVRAESKNKPDKLYRLYSTKAQRFIWDENDRCILSQEGSTNGFIDISTNGTTVQGFISAKADSVVVLDSLSQLSQMGDDIVHEGDNRIFSYLSGVGVTNDMTGSYIAPVYEEIKPLRHIVASAPEGWMLTRRNSRYGLIFNGNTALECIYNKINTQGDSTVTFTLSSWPHKGYRDPIKKVLATSISKSSPYTICMTFSDSIAVNDNFGKILSELSDIKDERELFETYYNLYDMCSYSSNQNFLNPLALQTANNMRHIVIEKLTEGKGDFQSKEGVLFAQSLYSQMELDTDANNCQELANAVESDINVRQQEARRLQEEEHARQQAQRQSRAEAWGQLAAALGQMANSINQALGNSRSSKKQTYTPPRSNNTVRSSSSSSSSSSSEYIPVTVLEVWIPSAGSKSEPTYEERTMYKRYYGNRWCLFATKNSRNFHVAHTNSDKKCGHVDVSGFKYKTSDPKIITGTKYYYFN